MKRARRRTESAFYPILEKWMVKHFRCSKSAINVGLQYSRVGVLGVRDIGGSLSGDIETIVIEVKRGTEPFATASGQTLGYQVYANRVYLADQRADGFAQSELEIASHLGIGLVQIRGSACREILSSPHYRPIVRMSLELVEKLALGKYQLCGTFFAIGAGRDNRFSRLTRNRIDRAILRERGLMFWSQELADRKRKRGIRTARPGWSYERRYICPECLQTVFEPFLRQP
jgi:hypothetical protein